MHRRVTSIADLARVAGVSQSTVSRALHDSPLISVEVRQRVQQLAREMGYLPNGIAQSLQTQRTNTIGLVVTSIADPFWADVMQGVDEVALPAGLSVFLSTSHNIPAQEMFAIDTFQRRRVDGMLVAASRISLQYLEQRRAAHVPTVLINSQAEGQHELIHSVLVDDDAGAQLAVEHLLQLGHRAIGYLGTANRPASNRRRLHGYRQCLLAAGVSLRDELVVIAPEVDEGYEDDVAAGQALFHPLLNAGATAIFCYNDMIATGVLMACRSYGIAVPEQLSVVGFDDIHLSRYVTPPLTTISQPKLELGRTAMRMLLKLLDGGSAQSVVLAPSLVARASSAAAPDARRSMDAPV